MDKKNNTVEEQTTRAASKSEPEEGNVTEMASEVVTRNMTLVNKAIQDIGFGPYQLRLFFTCGFGFFVDQVSGCSLPLSKKAPWGGIADGSGRCSWSPWVW